MAAWSKTMAKIIAKKIGYAITIFIVMIALVICLSPFLSPYLDKQRGIFEKLAGSFLAMPVTIHDVQFSWYCYQPEISLNQVTLINQETQQTALKVQKISVFLSLFKSLWQHTLVPAGMMVTGTAIQIKEIKQGEWQINNFTPVSNTKNASKAAKILEWALKQPHLILRHIAVQYDELNGKRYHATLQELTVKNMAGHHAIQGSGVLNQKIPMEISGCNTMGRCYTRNAAATTQYHLIKTTT